ncbi:unnamed protein product [Leuciscus chuanchicus]
MEPGPLQLNTLTCSQPAKKPLSHPSYTHIKKNTDVCDPPSSDLSRRVELASGYRGLRDGGMKVYKAFLQLTGELQRSDEKDSLMANRSVPQDSLPHPHNTVFVYTLPEPF